MRFAISSATSQFDVYESDRCAASTKGECNGGSNALACTRDQNTATAMAGAVRDLLRCHDRFPHMRVKRRPPLLNATAAMSNNPWNRN
jgi:hypothetical protein